MASGPFADDPLGYGPHWLAYNGPGGQTIGDNVELGRDNDLQFHHSDFEGATIVRIADSNNAAFAGLNAGGNPPVPSDPHAGGVGVFGQSTAGGESVTIPLPDAPLTLGIGVAGHCNTGYGVYGQSIFGAGVAGTVSTAGGHKAPGLAKTFQRAGVLGQSDFGPGVRGHGSALDTGAPLFNPECDPGGAFSSGLRLDVVDAGAGPRTQDVSTSSGPQLRLVPFKAVLANLLPATGQIGDFFVAFQPPMQNPSGVTVSAALFVCLGVDAPTKRPVWFKVAASPVDVQGLPFYGGTPIR